MSICLDCGESYTHCECHPPKCQCVECIAMWKTVDDILSNAMVPPAPPETIN